MKLFTCLPLAVALVFSLSLFCQGQETIHRIQKLNIRNQPLVLMSAHVGNKNFNEKNEILAGRDWLKNLKLTVKNISNKKIVYFNVLLQVPKLGKMQAPLFLNLSFGNKPLPEVADADFAKFDGLMPNQSVDVSIVPQNLEFFTTKFAPENEVGDIEQLKLIFDFVVFDDGTAWERGPLMRRNPNNGNRWEIISASPNGVISFQNTLFFNETVNFLSNPVYGKNTASCNSGTFFFFKLLNA